jgi:hypothetical protein
MKNVRSISALLALRLLDYLCLLWSNVSSTDLQVVEFTFVC